MIQIENLQKIYKTGSASYTALHHINLTIAQGETVAIMGKSGAGKTTLMNIIGCLDVPTQGNYTIDGMHTEGLTDKQLSKIRNEQIGFVLQDFALLPHKSVLFNVMLPMYFDKTPWRDMKSAALSALEKTGIAALSRKKVRQLSGGQKQRVALARALVKRPSIILADEPTGALDSETGAAIMSTLIEMNENGTTVIIVTHDEEIASYCKRKIVLSDGAIISDTLSQY